MNQSPDSIGKLFFTFFCCREFYDYFFEYSTNVGSYGILLDLATTLFGVCSEALVPFQYHF